MRWGLAWGNGPRLGDRDGPRRADRHYARAQWEAIDNKPQALLFVSGAILAVWLSGSVVGTINKIPMASAAGPSTDAFAARGSALLGGAGN